MDLKIISWNIRGIRGDSKRCLFKNRILTEKPVVIMVQETKSSKQIIIDFITQIWRNAQAIALDAKGSAGGIAIV